MVAQQSRPTEPQIIEKEVIREVPVIEYVEVEKPVEKIVQVSNTAEIQTLNDIIQQLTEKLNQQENTPQEDELRHAARLMANSEMNKEDLTEDEIYDFLVKCSEDELKKKVGFWAVPLPKDDTPEPDVKYTVDQKGRKQ